MFKILLLLVLQFCSRNLEMGVEYKQPILAQDNIDLQGFFGSFSFACDGKGAERKVGSRFGIDASKYKDKYDRNLLANFLIYSSSYQGHWDSFFDALDFFIKLNKESLFARDNLDNNFLHYLIIYTASIVGEADRIEERVVEVLNSLDLTDCDAENSFGLTQVLLAELLGLKKISETIKGSNKANLYKGNTEKIKEIETLRKDILKKGFSFAIERNWSEAEAYTFILIESLNNIEYIPTSVLGYCMISVSDDVKKTLLEAFHRNNIFEKRANERSQKRKSCLSSYIRATNTASMSEKATESGDKDLVIALSGNVDKRDLCQSLYQAARYGHNEILDYLLSLEVDPNEWEPYWKETPLAAAARNNQKDIVVRLLKVPGIDVNKSGEAGRSPIELAIKCSKVAIVEAILDAGAELNKVPSISIAIQSNNTAAYEIVEELLKRKADPNHISKGQGEKTSPLQEAAGQTNVKLVELLLANGANPNLLGCSVGPLYLAARSCNLTLIAALLKGGADPNFCIKVEFSPLLSVAGQLVMYERLSTGTSNSYEENISQLKQVKDLLEKNGAKINIPKNGMFPIHKIAQSTSKLSDDMMRALLDSGVDADLEDSVGKTPLYYAGSACQVEKFISLMRKKASLDKATAAGLDITALSKKGERALIHHLAEAQYFDEILEIKKSYKALNLNVQTGTGKTILHYAAIKNVKDSVIDALIEAGCKLNLKEHDSKYGPGRYPIQVALRAKNWRIFRHLYRKMLVDRESTQLLEKDRNLRLDIDSRATDGKIKEFMKKAQEDAKGKGKKRKVGDDSVGPKKKKAKVVQAGPKGKVTKRKAYDDVDDKEKAVKKAKVVQKGKKAKGKKK